MQVLCWALTKGSGNLASIGGTDPEHEYFSDGISEDIITALSKLRWFFVIARNSSFIYKGKAVHMKQVAEELGAI
jgi:TolB-like protein